MSRPSEIIIDLDALKHNCDLALQAAPASQLVAAIKADAYGHGSIEVAKALQQHVDVFALSCLEEARLIREAGINKRLLLLEGCFSADEYKACARLGIDIVVHQQQQVQLLCDATLSSPLRVWLKVDTGMHRLGISPDETVAMWQQLAQIDTVSDLVLTTHLASADETDNPFTEQQLSTFANVRHSLERELGHAVKSSIANSAGLLAWPDSHGSFNRPGIMLYGLTPFSHAHALADQLVPVMTFQSRVIAIRTIEAGERVGYGNTWQASQRSVIATVAAGYGDGYPRTAQSGTPVLVKGQRASLVGRVSMDMITVDVTHIADVAIGDEIELWGQKLSANEVAQWAHTNGYELVTRMPLRTPKRYVSSSDGEESSG